MMKWTCTAMMPDGGIYGGWVVCSGDSKDDGDVIGFFARGIGWMDLPPLTVFHSSDDLFVVLPSYADALEFARLGHEHFDYVADGMPQPDVNVRREFYDTLRA